MAAHHNDDAPGPQVLVIGCGFGGLEAARGEPPA
jgi:hypothetical protein